MLNGTLHIMVAFDWGEEIDLEHVRHLVEARFHALPRRRRTPSSIAYQPAPLQLDIPNISLDMHQLGAVQATTAATLFDFGAVSLALQIPFHLAADQLQQLASSLADPSSIVDRVRTNVMPLFEQLRPAVREPDWNPALSEEYVVFEFSPCPELTPNTLCDVTRPQSTWLASLVRLDSGPLSSSEVIEALRVSLSYRPDDLFVADWTAAVLVDRDCEESLEVIEFANFQLLELRHIDTRLDASMSAAYRVVHPTIRRGLPFWRTYTRPLRLLGELKVEANGLFERAGNALKLVGDNYLARVYRLLSARFALDTWQRSIERSLHVAEDVYSVVSDQAAAFRAELLEVLVVLLIVIEIVLAFWHH